MFYIDKQGRKIEFSENYTAEEKKGKRCFTDPAGVEHCVDDNSKVETFEMPSGMNMYYIGGGVLAVAVIIAVVMYMRKQKRENYEPSSSSSEGSVASFGFRFA